MHWVRRLIGAAIVVAVLVGGWRFAAENAAQISVHYLWGSRELAQWQALVLSFGAGFLLAGMGGLVFALRARLVRRRYRKALNGLEAEVHQLRNLPLSPDPEGETRPELGGRAG